MRRPDRGFFPPKAPKLPPPEDGIRIKRSGTTWWGQRWLEALERISPDYASRLARGRSYARAGRTHDVVVKAGEVTARVTGTRPEPYRVRIGLKQLDDATWSTAIRAMAQRAQFAAELLAGAMPEAIDAAFSAAGATLFPARGSDLRTECSCPDWANPCKHVAATHYVLGEALDKDPFLLFELRGRTRDEVLASLRAARRAPAAGADRRQKRKRKGGKRDEPAPERITRADYDRWREPPPALRLALEPPKIAGALLRQLGAPPSWNEKATAAELLAPIVRATSERALRIALATASPASETEEASESDSAHQEHARVRSSMASRRAR